MNARNVLQRRNWGSFDNTHTSIGLIFVILPESFLRRGSDISGQAHSIQFTKFTSFNIEVLSQQDTGFPAGAFVNDDFGGG